MHHTTQSPPLSPAAPHRHSVWERVWHRSLCAGAPPSPPLPLMLLLPPLPVANVDVFVVARPPLALLLGLCRLVLLWRDSSLLSQASSCHLHHVDYLIRDQQFVVRGPVITCLWATHRLVVCHGRPSSRVAGGHVCPLLRRGPPGLLQQGGRLPLFRKDPTKLFYQFLPDFVLRRCIPTRMDDDETSAYAVLYIYIIHKSMTI